MTLILYIELLEDGNARQPSLQKLNILGEYAVSSEKYAFYTQIKFRIHVLAIKKRLTFQVTNCDSHKRKFVFAYLKAQHLSEYDASTHFILRRNKSRALCVCLVEHFLPLNM